MIIIKDILNYCKKNNCSDIHISSFSQITLRLDGSIVNLPGLHNPTSEEVYSCLRSITSEKQMKNYLDNQEIDFDTFGIYVGNRAKIKGAK